MNRDLYETLGLDHRASDVDIKKAYFRLARVFHPDKNPARDSAEAFLGIHRAYSVLKDPKFRRAYDTRGAIPVEVVDLPTGRMTMDDLVSFEKRYRGSPREREDVLREYEKFQNVEMVIKRVPFSTVRDKNRFMKIISTRKQAE